MAMLTLEDALYVPTFTSHILSVGCFLSSPNNGITLSSTIATLSVGMSSVPLQRSGNLVWLLTGSSSSHSAPVLPVAPTSSTAAPSPPPVSLSLLHDRLGHAGVDECVRVAKEQGLKLSGGMDLQCEDCDVAKLRKLPITAQATRDAVQPGAIIHCDLKGPLDVSYNGSRWAAVFVDQATRATVTISMATKDKLPDALRDAIVQFATLVPNYSIRVKGIVHSDSEAVFLSHAMKAVLADNGLSLRASPPHTPQRNGIAERAIQSLFDKVRVLLMQAKLPRSLWPVALQHATYLHNYAHHVSSLGNRSPVCILTGTQPSLAMLRRFGAAVYVRVDDVVRQDLDPKGKLGVYVGHNTVSNSHRVMMQKGSKLSFISSIHVSFHENTLGYAAPPTSSSPSVPATAARVKKTITPVAPPQPVPPAAPTKDPLLDFEDDDGASVHVAAAYSPSPLPTTYQQAVSGADAVHWQAAIAAEINSLNNNGTFLVTKTADVGEGCKTLSSRWVFNIKSSNEGYKYKARLVARGDRQRPGVDFNEVYAPVMNASTLRAMLAIAAVKDYELDNMDAVTAFLNAPVDTELYLSPPEGFAVAPGHVLRLQKSLYGLRQSPRAWNATLHAWMISYGLRQSEIDSCLYYIPNRLWIAFWVDDFLVMAVDAVVKNAFKDAISARFDMKDLGAAKTFLGMEVVRDRGARKLTVTAINYTNDILLRYGMSDSRPVATPLPTRTILSTATEDAALLHPSIPYRGIVGSLLYLAMWVRPDISFAVSQLARFQSCPSEEHYVAAKHLLRYVKGTVQQGITYSATPRSSSPLGISKMQDRTQVLHGYVDASWGEDMDTRRSQTGFAFMFGNAAISWGSRLQTTVATSSTDAEYLALSDAVKEGLYLRNLFVDLLSKPAASVPILEDNQSTIRQVLNLQSSKRSKHIDIRHHFIKQCALGKEIVMEYVPTGEQIADCLTKCLDRVKVSLFRQMILGV